MTYACVVAGAATLEPLMTKLEPNTWILERARAYWREDRSAYAVEFGSLDGWDSEDSWQAAKMCAEDDAQTTGI